MSGLEWIGASRRKLTAIDLPASYVNLIISKVFEQDITTFMMQDEVETKELDYFLTEILTKKKPAAYILNREYFYNSQIYVNESVLIPRIETEEVVDQTIKHIRSKYPKGSSLSILDLCCGSGCIAIAMYKELVKDYQIEITGLDVSEKALEVAEYNITQLKLPIKLIAGDFIEPLIAANMKYDIIICNPPYIDPTDVIESLVYDNEPHLALFAKDQGLYFYQVLLKAYDQLIKERGMISLEIGKGQEFAIGQINETLQNKVIRDLQGVNRGLILEKKIKK